MPRSLHRAFHFLCIVPSQSTVSNQVSDRVSTNVTKIGYVNSLNGRRDASVFCSDVKVVSTWFGVEIIEAQPER